MSIKCIFPVILIMSSLVSYSASSKQQIIKNALTRKIAKEKYWALNCNREVKWLPVGANVILLALERNKKDPYPFVEEKAPGKFQIFVIKHNKRDGIIESPANFTYLSLYELLSFKKAGNIFKKLNKQYNITWKDVQKLQSNPNRFIYSTKSIRETFPRNAEWVKVLKVLENSIKKDIPKCLADLDPNPNSSSAIDLAGGSLLIRNFSIYDNQMEGIMYENQGKAYQLQIIPIRNSDLTIKKFEICFFKINDISILEKDSFRALQYPLLWEMKLKNGKLELDRSKL